MADAVLEVPNERLKSDSQREMVVFEALPMKNRLHSIVDFLSKGNLEQANGLVKK